MVFFGIAVLISGVVLLSLKSSAKSATDPYTVSARPTPSMRLNPRSRAVSKQSEHEEEDDSEHGSPSRPKRDEVMWEVGSVSDDEEGERKLDPEAEQAKPQGLGEGSGHGHGERRGLLDEDEEVEGDGEDRDDQTGPHEKDENEEFGEYEAVRRTSLDGPSKSSK